MKNDYYTRLNILEGFILVCLLISFVALYSCIPAHAGVSNGQPVSAAVTNAAFMDKNTATTFTIALTDIQGGIETKSAADSTSTGTAQNITLSAPITIFTNASLVSIQNLTFTNRSDATLVTIRNNTGSSLTIKNLSGGTAANQINTGIGVDLAMFSGTSIQLYYDTVNSKWQIISPTVNAAMLPVLTGDVTTTSGSLVTTVAKIQGTAVSGTTGSGNVVFSASPTMTGTVTLGTGAALAMNGSGSGTVSLKTQSGAGTWEFDLPTTAGSAGQVLTSQAGGGTAMTWTTVTTPSVSALNNVLYNGAFDIWQRGTSSTVTFGSEAYVAPDRWVIVNSMHTAGVVTASQTTGAQSGSIYGLNVHVSTAPGTGTATSIDVQQIIENPQTLSELYNQNVSLGVYVKALGNVNSIHLQFLYATTEVVPTNTISATTCSVNSSTFTLCKFENVSIGTSMTTSGAVTVGIGVDAVSSGAVYDLNNGFILEQAMVTQTATAQAFSRRGGSYLSDYLGDLRFYEKSYDIGTSPGTNTGTDSNGSTVMRMASGITSTTEEMRWHIPFTVPMRKAPTMTGYSTDGTSAKFRDRTASANVTPTFAGTGRGGTHIDVTANGASTAYFIEGHWTADAEILF